MQLLKLLVILVFLFIQVTPNLADGIVNIPSGLSWYNCSDQRTSSIDFLIESTDPKAIVQTSTPQDEIIGNFRKGAISTDTYINPNGLIDTFVIRLRYLEQYFDSSTIDDVSYYPEFSCNNVAGGLCKRHTTNKRSLPYYDYQCIIVANPNPVNVTIVYEINFFPVDESGAMKLSGGKNSQIVLIGFICVLVSLIYNYVIM